VLAQDVIAQDVRRRRISPARLIAAALILVLAAGGAGAVALKRHQDHHADLVARATLDRAVFTISAVGVATDHRVALVLSVTSTTKAKLVGAHVTGPGWASVHDKDVGLVRAVDCKSAPVLPLTAAATVELHGQRRDVDLLTDPGLADVVTRTSREACGDIEARRALTVKASGTVRVPGGLQLALVVTNRSAHRVLLRGINVGRLHLRTSKRFPTFVAPHATFRTIVVLDARGCGSAAPFVNVAIDGVGGKAHLTVPSADLAQLAPRMRREHCPR
jgi:hypothetical protein